jgi:hypothetical protein
MTESLPVLNYNGYEETAFDVTPILEGIVNGVVVFGVLSLQSAEGVKEIPDAKKVYGGFAQEITAVMNGAKGTGIHGKVAVVPFEAAYQRVASDRLAKYLKERRRVLLDRGAAKAVFLAGKRPPVPAQKPKPVPVPPVPEPKPAPVVPQSPVTMTELLLQMAAMQTDFDLRLQVMAQRLSVLEVK